MVDEVVGVVVELLVMVVVGVEVGVVVGVVVDDVVGVVVTVVIWHRKNTPSLKARIAPFAKPIFVGHVAPPPWRKPSIVQSTVLVCRTGNANSSTMRLKAVLAEGQSAARSATI